MATTYPSSPSGRSGVSYTERFYTESKELTTSSGTISGATTNTLSGLIWAITIAPTTASTTWKIVITGTTSGTIYRSLTSLQTGTQTVVPAEIGMPIVDETLKFTISSASKDEAFTILTYLV